MFTVESPAGFFIFFQGARLPHITGQPPKMSVRMPLSKALKPEQQHRSCSLATNEEIKQGHAGRKEAQQSCFLKTPFGPDLLQKLQLRGEDSETLWTTLKKRTP